MKVTSNNVPEYYKLSGHRAPSANKDNRPHSPKTTFELSTVAVVMALGIWVAGLLWMATMILKN